jgi:sugar phosphate permease
VVLLLDWDGNLGLAMVRYLRLAVLSALAEFGHSSWQRFLVVNVILVRSNIASIPSTPSTLMFVVNIVVNFVINIVVNFVVNVVGRAGSQRKLVSWFSTRGKGMFGCNHCCRVCIGTLVNTVTLFCVATCHNNSRETAIRWPGS